MEGELLNPAPSADVGERTEFILSKLGDDDAAPQTEATESASPVEADGGPAETPAPAADEGNSEPAPPALDPPKFWSAEAREKFKALPPDLQAVVAQQEEEAHRARSRAISETAEQRKAAEAERQAAALERQRYAQSLDHFIQAAQTLDPILAEGQRTDWAALARDNPAEYVQKWAAYQQRAGQIQVAMQQREHLAAQQRAEHFAREEAALVQKVPEWADLSKGKAAIQEIKDAAVNRYGFKPDEVQVIGDHRYALILRDALAYHKLMAAQKTATEKKVVAPPPRVQKPQAATGDGSKSERVVARLKQAKWSDRVEDRANAILAALD